jgi:hypothetical protein
MIKLFSKKLALLFWVLLIAICHGCTPAEAPATVEATQETQQPIQKPVATEQKLIEKSEVKPPADPNIVAIISDYSINKKELKNRLLIELNPRYSEYYDESAMPINAETVLKKMIAEKAMIIDARKKNYLKDESIQAAIERTRNSNIVRLLLQNHVQGKINVTDEQIEEKLKANPKLDRVRIKRKLEYEQRNKIATQYYKQIYEKSNVKKLKENFPQAIQLHRKLLRQSKKPRKMVFVHNYQVEEELTPEEKNIVLATYDGGKMTLKDWFQALCDISPPSRPRDLNTSEGFERMLDRALRMPLCIAEAESLGLDKDENLLNQIKQYEDRLLLGKAQNEKLKEVNEPTTEQMKAYFNENKESFMSDKYIKINQIWCQDLETARKVKAELDSGKDIEIVRQEYDLYKKGKAVNTYPNRERMFWEQLWAGEPNEIVGPIKGLTSQGVKWRVVKILEKNPGTLSEFSSKIENNVKSRMRSEQQQALLANYRKELLEKYPHEIYTDRIKDIDPFDIP